MSCEWIGLPIDSLSTLFVRYTKLSSSQIYFWPGNTWYIHCVYWDSINKKKRKKIKLKRTQLVSVSPIIKNLHSRILSVPSF